jgi:hypothetical protein
MGESWKEDMWISGVVNVADLETQYKMLVGSESLKRWTRNKTLHTSRSERFPNPTSQEPRNILTLPCHPKRSLNSECGSNHVPGRKFPPTLPRSGQLIPILKPNFQQRYYEQLS